MDHGESIGMMAGAYFVGRAELLRWINELTGLNYSKIEQTASGIFACHVFDALFPGSVRMEKVKYDAKHQYEYVHNYKVLQAALNRNGMKKQIEVEKLIKGKYQDNLEFMQWIKAFYDSHASEDALDYDGRARREEILAKTGTRRTALASNRLRPNEARPAPTRRVPRSRTMTGSRPSVPMVPKAELDGMKAELEKMANALDDAETERTFYFEKLRNVEVIVQTLQEDMEDDAVTIETFKDIFGAIRDTLYAEDDQEAQPVEDGYDAEGAELGPEVYDEV